MIDEISMVEVTIEGSTIVIRDGKKVTEILFHDEQSAKEEYEALRKGEYDF